MYERIQPITILMAEDDPDDRLLTEYALLESRLANGFYYVEDGIELLDYLYKRGKYEYSEDAPYPDLILLDLNMPRMDGCEALEEIKADSELRRIPIVVLTTSKAEEDILKTYNLGVSGFITKPVSIDGLVEAMKSVGEYWFSIVKLPPNNEQGV